jgi:hypothetical protein
MTAGAGEPGERWSVTRTTTHVINDVVYVFKIKVHTGTRSSMRKNSPPPSFALSEFKKNC